MGDATNSPRKAGPLSVLTVALAAMIVTGADACPAPDQLRATKIDKTFIQEKLFAGTSKPLRSEGHLTANVDEVIWHMTAPFDVKTIISPKGIEQSVDNGPAQPVGSGSSDIGISIAKSMAALMRGRWEELKSMFSVSFLPVPNAADWTVTLTPLDQRLASVLGTISVHGCADVKAVAIERPNGDRETIQFSDQVPTAVPAAQ